MGLSTGELETVTVSERILNWRGCDGNLLVGEAFGDESRPPVLLLHGGGQTRHAWGGTGKALAAAGFYAVSLDMRGHGQSDWVVDGNYRVSAYAQDLCAVVPNFASPPAVVGASLGGMAALLAQGEHPGPLLSALVLVDVAHRLERTGVDRVLGFMTGHLEGFATLEDAANAIAAYMPHRKRPRDLGGLAKNLRLGADGRYRWHWDPAFLDRRVRGTQDDLPERLEASARSLKIPTLLVRGRLSDVMSQEVADEFRTLAPATRLLDVKAAAHMVAGDKNDIFTEAVVGFLRELVAVESLAPST